MIRHEKVFLRSNGPDVLIAIELAMGKANAAHWLVDVAVFNKDLMTFEYISNDDTDLCQLLTPKKVVELHEELLLKQLVHVTIAEMQEVAEELWHILKPNFLGDK